MATAADVPGKYDLVINSQGYILANSIAPNLPFRTQRARYGYTPTFVQRSNVSGNYGDGQQDYFLTASQNDWTGGEDQKYFRQADPSSVTKCWRTANVDLSKPGQAMLNQDKRSLTFAAAVQSAVYFASEFYTSSTTNLYSVDGLGNITDRGAHGAGGTLNFADLATDANYLYKQGGTKLRTMNAAHTFADWSTAQGEPIFFGNTIYTTDPSIFHRLDVAGADTPLFPFKDGKGGTDLNLLPRAAPIGGKIFVVLLGGAGNGRPDQVWEWDGAGMQQVAEFPASYQVTDFCVSEGITFFSGRMLHPTGTTAVYYLANGSLGILYTTTDPAGTITPGICSFRNGVLFVDSINNFTTNARAVYYDLSTGGVYTMFNFAAGSGQVTVAASPTGCVVVQGTTSGFQWPAAIPTSGTVTTSLFDFDSSLTKLFRGVIVDFDHDPTGVGNGGTVDVAYRLNDLSSTYTSLATNITSGTEVSLAGLTGHSISIQVTLNKGTSTNGPVLKRIFVRAAPILPQYRTGEYVIDMTGINGKTPVVLRNGNASPLDGQAILDLFLADATSTTPVTIVDHLSTYVGIIDLSALDVIEWRPNEYIVHFSARGV